MVATISRLDGRRISNPRDTERPAGEGPDGAPPRRIVVDLERLGAGRGLSSSAALRRPLPGAPLPSEQDRGAVATDVAVGAGLAIAA